MRDLTGRLRPLFVAVILLASACSSDAATSPSTTRPSPETGVGDDVDASARLTQEELDELVGEEVAANPTLAGQIVEVLAPGLGVEISSATGVTAPASTEPLGAEATVRIASVTKTFTAAAVWRLVEQGQVDVEGTLAASGIPAPMLDLLRNDGYDLDRITIRQLLNHTSGIADYAGNDDGATEGPYRAAVLADPERSWTALEQVQLAVESFDRISAPGAAFHYSDTGYVLLGQLLETRTGSGYGEAMRSLLDYDGLGLTDTHLEAVEPVPAGAGPRAAQRLGDVLVNDLSPTIDLYGGGGLVSSMHDLALFFRALGRNEVFEQSDTFEVMSSTVAPGTESAAAAGVYRTTIGDATCWFHDGFWGVQAVTCPGLDLTIARTWNQAVPPDGFDPSDLLVAIAAALEVDEVTTPNTATPVSAERLLEHRVAVADERCPAELPPSARCGLATVPLDWTTPTGSTIDVWFGHQPAPGGSGVGTVVPVVGGPGGAVSTALADFQPVGAALPDRDLLFVDIRGVGRSSRLSCPSIDTDSLPFGREHQTANAECAQTIGPERDFYRTVASVLDIEAIRRVLELPPPSLLSFSYGTFLATTYAVLFPSEVRAAVLDGGVPLDRDIWGRGPVSSIGPVTRRVCARTSRCDPDTILDHFRAVTAALEAAPQAIPGETQALTEGLLAYMSQAYVPQGSPEFLAGLTRAAQGDFSTLVELARPAIGIPPADALGDSFSLGAAVICNDYQFPYDLTTPVRERRGTFDRLLASLPEDAFDPFSRQGWVHSNWDHPDECLEWPAIEVPTELLIPDRGPFPEVPILVINGDLDLQTPLPDALATAAQFPNSVLVEVTNAPHTVIPVSPCALRIALAFLDTAILPPADACALEPLPPPGM